MCRSLRVAQLPRATHQLSSRTLAQPRTPCAVRFTLSITPPKCTSPIRFSSRLSCEVTEGARAVTAIDARAHRCNSSSSMWTFPGAEQTVPAS